MHSGILDFRGHNDKHFRQRHCRPRVLRSFVELCYEWMTIFNYYTKSEKVYTAYHKTSGTSTHSTANSMRGRFRKSSLERRRAHIQSPTLISQNCAQNNGCEPHQSLQSLRATRNLGNDSRQCLCPGITIPIVPPTGGLFLESCEDPVYPRCFLGPYCPLAWSSRPVREARSIHSKALFS